MEPMSHLSLAKEVFPWLETLNVLDALLLVLGSKPRPCTGSLVTDQQGRVEDPHLAEENYSINKLVCCIHQHIINII